MDSNPAGWGHTRTPGPTGLRLRDVETGHYASIPEHGSEHGSMAPRGCSVPPETRSLGMYTVNEKSEVWAENAALLYDEAVVLPVSLLPRGAASRNAGRSTSAAR